MTALYVLSEQEHCCGYTVLAVCDTIERAKEIASELSEVKEIPWKETENGCYVEEFRIHNFDWVYIPPYDIERFDLNVNPKAAPSPVHSG